MRRVITFILRLWVEAGPKAPAWEGQAECLATGQRLHVRGEADVAQFLDGQLAQAQAATAENQPAGGKKQSG